jgi:hypothetical protein
MKKLFMVLGVVGVIALSSCSKEYECNCTDSSGVTTTDPGFSYEGKGSGTAYEAAKAVCEISFSDETCTMDEK